MYTAERSYFFPDQHRLDSAWVPGRCRHLVHFRGSIRNDPLQERETNPLCSAGNRFGSCISTYKMERGEYLFRTSGTDFSDILYSIGQWRRERGNWVVWGPRENAFNRAPFFST
ncbi:hypothetical protein AVEN_221120-1 [Araneus ventricosus]|uniref:Uncharacterized protein n=1 Tax=Araneus ventricosus TaxID=182803 RepID=A0A4Y2WCL0_ARAVE|nr:hypothetical protein AVEN_221120-1 [Araneus ventricosus]